MDVSDFHLERATFEFRYPDSFFIWDRAGAMWFDMKRKWPKLSVKHGEPGKIQFTLESRDEFIIQSDRAYILAAEPKTSLKDLADLASEFVSIVTKHMEVTDLPRVGLRLGFFKEYPSLKAASEQFLSMNLLNLPSAPQFGVTGTFNNPEYSVRLESDKIGVTVRSKVAQRRIDFDVPINVKGAKSIHEDFLGIEFDIDYFTIALIGVSQLSVIDWIGQGLHVIKRDSRHFLGGGKQ